MRNTTKKISEETTDLDKNLTVDGSDIETSSKYNGNSLETPKVSGEPIEIYNNNAETDTLKAMFYTARECAANAGSDGHNFLVDYLDKETETTWLCRKCGYLHKGKSVPEQCPNCFHTQGYF